MKKETAVVTGAGKGIGRELALRLAKLDYNIVLAARNEGELKAVAELCRAAGCAALPVVTDVTDEAAVVNLFKAVREHFGGVDLLVNNAGMGVFKTLAETTLAEWRLVIETNLNGAFVCAREAFRIMMTQESGGTIVNIASVVGIKGYPNQGAYTASKHGMVGLTKVLAEEGREYKIKAHVICPGGVATEMVRQSRPDLNPDEIIQPEDVADLLEYLVKLPPRVSVDLVHLRRFNSSSF
ncbi:MAG: SDR family oxidoreductase [Lentisphaerae bacterium]|nr:SDR family oxidoreductase [Lentisphaerota bacterium]